MANVVEIVIKATDQATAQIRQVEGSVGRMSELLTALGGPAGVIGAIATGLGAMALAAKRFGDEIESLDKTAAALGVTINQVRVLHQIEREAGLGQGELTSAMARANRFIGEQGEQYRALGIQASNVIEFTKQLGDQLRNTSDQGLKNTVTTQAMGRSSAELIAVLQQFPGLYDEIAAGLVQLDDLQIEVGRSMDVMADNLSRAWDNLITKVKQLAISMFIASPLFLPFIKAFGTNTPPPTSGPGVRRPPAAGGKGGGGGASDVDLGFYPWAGGLGHPGYHGGGVGDIVMPEVQVVGQAMDNLRTMAQGVAYGIADAFSVAFSMIGQKGATLGRVLSAAFQAMTQSILNALAQIAASKLLLWIASMLPAGGAPGMIGSVFGKVGKILGGGDLGTGNTYVINAMDARDVMMQIQSPYGGLRRASDRVAVGAGY